MRRTQPLVNVDAQQFSSDAEFTTKWDAGELDEEWVEAKKVGAADSGEGVWCSACQKMYSKQTVYDAHLTSKKHVKAAAKQPTDAPPANPNGPPANGTPAPAASTSNHKDKHRVTAQLTYLSAALLAGLVAVLADTKANVERRFSLTAREREQELLEQSRPQPPPTATKADGTAEEEEEEEERIYNPLKLPLGWDGKPIPYWLYKLHGLGVEYRCEICSDHVYMGRYATSILYRLDSRLTLK